MEPGDPTGLRDSSKSVLLVCSSILSLPNKHDVQILFQSLVYSNLDSLRNFCSYKKGRGKVCMLVPENGGKTFFPSQLAELDLTAPE